MQSRQEQSRQLRPVLDEGTGEPRIEDRPDRVQRHCHRRRLGHESREQRLRAPVRSNNVIVPIHHNHGIRLLLLEHPFQRPGDRPAQSNTWLGFVVDLLQSRRRQQRILVPQRQLKNPAQPQNHLHTRSRPRRLQKAHMA